VKTRNEVSAGGVVFRLLDDEDVEVVLILTHEGRWQLPKGWIERDETPEQTAIREVREEAGVDSEVVGALDSIRYQYVSRYDDEPARVHKQVHFFLLQYAGGSTDDHDDEVQDARWVPLGDAVRTLAFKEERRIASLAEDALRGVLTAPTERETR